MVRGRSIRIGVGLAPPRGPTPFSPASLSPSAWFENDTSTMFTDTGTTLVTADGQAVQQWNDKSGNLRHATQATLASRPIYKAASAPYLQFDGVASAIEAQTLATYYDGAGLFWMAISCFGTNLTPSQYPFSLRENSGASSRFQIQSGVLKAYTDSGGTGLTPGFSPTTSVPFVAILELTPSALILTVDGNVIGSQPTSTALSTATAGLYIGDIASSLFFVGGVYGAITGTGTLSGAARANLQTYMAGLAVANAPVTTNVSPTTGHLLLTGYTPTVTTTVNVAPSTGHLTFGGKTPTITLTTNVAPTTGHLTFSGKTPAVTLTVNVSPTVGHLIFGGTTPTVTKTFNISPTTGHLTLSGKTPTIAKGLLVTAGTITFTGQTVNLRNVTDIPVTATQILFTPEPLAVNAKTDVVVTKATITYSGQTVAFPLHVNVATGGISFVTQNIIINTNTPVTYNTALSMNRAKRKQQSAK